ncbi:hypothetical protein [Pantoea ananatis]|uniref:hypothetical protein n=1 Tax=Pantoea ananas TaxID=553 RepID=UPI001B30F483|nr:hypothetical protein [Pantoea ananatis]
MKENRSFFLYTEYNLVRLPVHRALLRALARLGNFYPYDVIDFFLYQRPKVRGQGHTRHSTLSAW